MTPAEVDRTLANLRRAMAAPRSEPINWFDVIRDACALAYVLTVGIVAGALVVGIVVELLRAAGLLR